MSKMRKQYTGLVNFQDYTLSLYTLLQFRLCIVRAHLALNVLTTPTTPTALRQGRKSVIDRP